MNPLERSRTTTLAQSRAARLAGILLLLFSLGSILHYSVIDLPLFTAKNPAEIIDFVSANPLLFRIGIVFDILLFLSVLALAQTFYIILRNTHRDLALLAKYFILIETAVAITLELSSFLIISLTENQELWSAFNSQQLQDLLFFIVKTKATANSLVIMVFNLGFVLFFYMFYKSRHLPRFFGLSGLFLYGLMLFVIALKIIQPSALGLLGLINSSLVLLFQLILGLWLLIKGIVPETKQGKSLAA